MEEKVKIQEGATSKEVTREEFEQLKKSEGKSFRLKKLEENSYKKLDLLQETV